MRIFLGLAEVSGFYTNLRKGFAELGVDVELVTLSEHRFQYGDPAQKPGLWTRFARWGVAGRLKAQARGKLSRLFWAAMAAVSRLTLLIWAIVKFDVFIMGCSTSFFRFRELPILKLLGKKIIYIFHGTDGRPAFMDGFAEDTFLPQHLRDGTGYIPPFVETDSDEDTAARCEAYRQLIHWRKGNVDKINQYADIIVDSPSHGQHHTKPFVQRSIIGMPYIPNQDLLNQSAERAKPQGEGLVVLHSPSFPSGKGSPQIRAAIEAVRAKGHTIELIELTGRPNHEVLEHISRCDFVIDQAFSDMPMVGFATEAAFFGRPAIVGGYYADFLEKDLDSDWRPPTHFCHPDQLEAAVERLVTDAEYRAELGQRARSFVEAKWHATASARRLLQLLEVVPPEWIFDPQACDYPYGMGLPQTRLRGILGRLHDAYGDAVFCLDDKPELLRRIVAVARESDLKAK